MPLALATVILIGAVIKSPAFFHQCLISELTSDIAIYKLTVITRS